MMKRGSYATLWHFHDSPSKSVLTMAGVGNEEISVFSVDGICDNCEGGYVADPVGPSTYD